MADGASHPNTLHLLYDEREESKKNWNFCAKSVVMLRQQVKMMSTSRNKIAKYPHDTKVRIIDFSDN